MRQSIMSISSEFVKWRRIPNEVFTKELRLSPCEGNSKVTMQVTTRISDGKGLFEIKMRNHDSETSSRAGDVTRSLS